MLWLVILLVLLTLLVLLGLKLRPAAFPAFIQANTTSFTYQALPDTLPEPVSQFYKTVYGERVPIIETAVLSGRASLRFKGLTLPSRFRFTHEAGQNYRHYIESSFWAVPLLKVNEWYLEGESRLELPFGTIEGETQINQAANLGLWAESMWFPSIFLTDSRVYWEAIDETSARLYVPFEDTFDSFTVYFDADTKLMTRFEALRYKAADSLEKTLWRNDVLAWTEFDGLLLPSKASITWMDEGSPWAIFDVEEVIYNQDMSAYVRAKGL